MTAQLSFNKQQETAQMIAYSLGFISVVMLICIFTGVNYRATTPVFILFCLGVVTMSLMSIKFAKQEGGINALVTIIVAIFTTFFFGALAVCALGDFLGTNWFQWVK